MCCRWPGDVWLANEDIARLADHFGLDEQTFIDRYTRLAANRKLLSLREGEGDDCILLEGDRCSAYEARPRQCRGYPDEWRTDEPCPGYE